MKLVCEKIKSHMCLDFSTTNQRGHRHPLPELCTLTTEMSKVQRLHTDIVNMTAESLNF